MSNVTYTVPNKNGSYDGDMVVKQYTSINIDAGDTVTVDQPCRGMMILCQGDCTINGTLSMKERGANANPTTSGANDGNAVSSNGLQLPFLTASGTDTLTSANTLLNGCGTLARSVVANFKSISGTGTILTTVRTGGAGGAGGSIGGTGTGGTITNGTGGGGSGFWTNNGTATANGGTGTCFSGGSGSGGNNNGNNAYGGGANGGAGGNGGASNHNAWCGGGAGNPAGSSFYTGSYSGGSPTTAGGLGGLLILIVGGNLTIGASGIITAQGGNGSYISDPATALYSGDYASGGGQGGGGRIIIAHRGTYTNNGTVTAQGGNADAQIETGNAGAGGYGGNGAISVQSID